METDTRLPVWREEHADYVECEGCRWGIGSQWFLLYDYTIIKLNSKITLKKNRFPSIL